MYPQPQKNAHAHKMYLSTQGVLDLPDIVYELGLWNPALKENGSTQQVLVWLYYLLLKKSQVVIIQIILQIWAYSLLDRYYRGMIKIIDSNSLPAEQSKSFMGINRELL